MPRSYQKEKVEIYSKKDLEEAIKLIREGGHTVATITERFGIPDQTVRETLIRTNRRPNQVFGDELEAKLKRLLEKLVDAGHLRSWGEVLSKVVEFGRVIMLTLEMPSNWKVLVGKASWDWLYLFRKRQKFNPQFCKKVMQKSVVDNIAMCPAMLCGCGTLLTNEEPLLCSNCFIWTCSTCFEGVHCICCSAKAE